METVIAWLIIFAILCGCIFSLFYMLHRGPHSKENAEGSCDGNCSACAVNALKRMECEKNEKTE